MRLPHPRIFDYALHYNGPQGIFEKFYLNMTCCCNSLHDMKVKLLLSQSQNRTYLLMLRLSFVACLSFSTNSSSHLEVRMNQWNPELVHSFTYGADHHRSCYQWATQGYGCGSINCGWKKNEHLSKAQERIQSSWIERTKPSYSLPPIFS